MSDEYRVTSSHPEDLADGRVVGPGEVVSDVDISIPHNQRLLDDGAIVKIQVAKKKGKPDNPEVKE